jgi:CubicO group peptidase (beta-lactamase class C family)
MMLYEDGKFELDDPISLYVPELADKMVVRRSDDGPVREPAAREITFRHILAHTAGVDPERELLTPEEADLLGRRDTLEETILDWAGLPLAFSPGDEWEYGSSTDYVAYLVQRISGQRVDEFLQERIFGPLGMLDTGFNVPREKVNRVAAVYQRSGADIQLQLDYAPGEIRPTRYFGGVNGLFSTAADYFRFTQMLLNRGELDGVRLLEPTTVDLMTQNHVGDLPVRGCVNTNGYGFGLGFAVVTDPELTNDSLSKGSFGWCGAWTTTYWIDPTERLVMIFLTQLRVGGADIRRMFPGLVMQAITESYR